MALYLGTLPTTADEWNNVTLLAGWYNASLAYKTEDPLIKKLLHSTIRDEKVHRVPLNLIHYNLLVGYSCSQPGGRDAPKVTRKILRVMKRLKG